jgi:Uma2 family endonuclease
MAAITDISQLDLTKRYTYADYLLWEFQDRVELIKGYIVKMSPAPRKQHQKISFILSNVLYNYLINKDCEAFHAPFDVRLVKNKGVQDKEVNTVVQPDICVICDKSKLDDLGCVGAPDFIVEILSPGNKKHDEINKFNLYEENGVREYWIVDPDSKSVKTYILKDEKYELIDYYENPGLMIPVNIFEGLEVSWDEVFRE